MRLVSLYETVAGAALVVLGVVTSSWWSVAVGVLLVLKGVLTLTATGEATSWFRGDLDERRQRAVDRSFRVAFIVLAWWVAAVTVVAAARDVPAHGWTSAGIVIALVAAYGSYALRLRRA